MLQTVVGKNGTGKLAAMAGFDVIGKTGTVHRINSHGYSNDYNALFVGMVPKDHPKLVIGVIINDPKGHFNAYGGVSAAPVFTQVAKSALNHLGIYTDKSQFDTKTIIQNQQSLQSIIEA